MGSFLQLLLAVLPALAPFGVAAVKKAVKLPNLAKPIVNAAIGAGVAYATGQDPVVGVVVSTVAKSVRDALDVPETPVQ